MGESNCKRLSETGTCPCVRLTDCENACEVEDCGQMGLVPGASLHCADHYLTAQDEVDLAERLGMPVDELRRDRARGVTRVAFRSLSSWQKLDCISGQVGTACANPATLETYLPNAGVYVNVRSCAEVVCQARAAKIALHHLSLVEDTRREGQAPTAG